MSVPRRLPVSGTTTGFSCFFLPAALRLGALPLIGAVEFMGNHHELFTFLPLVCFERHEMPSFSWQISLCRLKYVSASQNQFLFTILWRQFALLSMREGTNIKQLRPPACSKIVHQLYLGMARAQNLLRRLYPLLLLKRPLAPGWRHNPPALHSHTHT